MNSTGWYFDIDGFDRTNWWEGQNGDELLEENAAHYELCRRHPAIQPLMRQWIVSELCGLKGREIKSWITALDLHLLGYAPHLDPKPTLKNVLAVVGRTTWLELRDEDRKAFVEALHGTSLKKTASRRAEICTLSDPVDLASKGDLKILVRRDCEGFADAVKLTTNAIGKATATRSFNPSAPNRFAAFRQALEKSMLVLAIDLESENPRADAEKLAEVYLKSHRTVNQSGVRLRNRCADWLAAIAKFDRAEAQRRNANEPEKVVLAQRRTLQKLLRSTEVQ